MDGKGERVGDKEMEWRRERRGEGVDEERWEGETSRRRTEEDRLGEGEGQVVGRAEERKRERYGKESDAPSTHPRLQDASRILPVSQSPHLHRSPSRKIQGNADLTPGERSEKR